MKLAGCKVLMFKWMEDILRRGKLSILSFSRVSCSVDCVVDVDGELSEEEAQTTPAVSHT